MNYVPPPGGNLAGRTPSPAVAAIDAEADAGPADAATSYCRHCGLPVAAGTRFCCSGCAGAHALVHDLGLDAYYRRRTIDPSQPALKPDDGADAPLDLTPFVNTDNARADDGTATVELVVEGLHCAACVWLIELVLARQPGVVRARVNMTTRRLALCWRQADADPAVLVEPVRRLGYRFVPFDARMLAGAEAERERALLRAMAVAGFAFGNVMLLSIAVWAGHGDGMGPATRTLMHWLSALIALPAIAYAGRPFFRPAFAALRHGRTNMDVPISLGVVLASAMSLHETIRGGEHAYFESAVGLLFFLLIGRYLDRRARGRARSSAEHLMMLSARAVTVVAADGTTRIAAPAAVRAGDMVLVAAGERIPVDGHVAAGESSLDTSLIDGEAMPKPAGPGTAVFAGTVNLAAPLRITVGAVGPATLLAEITRLVEAAEQQRSRYVVLADRIARFYTPFVHATALFTFLGWWLAVGIAWQAALLNAIAVLIITCPCALALAVPVVQVLAVGRLLRRGILVKSGTALERVAAADTVVFDKTGTLTEGRPQLLDAVDIPPAALARAAGLAAHSRHPLARALVRACERAGVPVVAAIGVREVAGEGMEAGENGAGAAARLGRRRFVGMEGIDPLAGPDGAENAPELWFAEPGDAARPLPLRRPPAHGCRRRRRRASSRRPSGDASLRRPDRGRCPARRDARHRRLAGGADAGRQGRGDQGPGSRRTAGADGRRRAQRCPGPGGGARFDVAGDGRRRQPDRGRRRLSGRPARSRRRDATCRRRRRPPRPPEPDPRLPLQRGDGAARRPRPGDAARGRDRHVVVVAPGHPERASPQPGAGVAMDIILYLIPAALFLGLIGLAAFLWALKSGQFDDLDGAAHRILFEDDEPPLARGPRADPPQAPEPPTPPQR